MRCRWTTAKLAWLNPGKSPRLRVPWSPDSNRNRLCGRQSSRRKQLVGRKALSQKSPNAGSNDANPEHHGSLEPSRIFDPTTTRPTPRPADRRPPLLPRRQTDRLHRRPHVRPGLNRRRHLLIPATGGEPKDLTPQPPLPPAYIAWLDDHDIGISEHAAAAPTSPPRLTPATTIPTSTSPSPNPSLPAYDVMSISTPTLRTSRASAVLRHPPRSGLAPSTTSSRSPTSTTPSNRPGARPNPSTGPTKASTSRAGSSIPATTIPSKKYPLIVSVHGGPSAPSRRAGRQPPTARRPFSALGYFVFMPNPRGSFGQGEKFTQANIKDFGYGDLRDILAGVERPRKTLPIDRTAKASPAGATAAS